MALGLFENLFQTPTQEEGVDTAATQAALDLITGGIVQGTSRKAAAKETKKFKVRQAPHRLKEYTKQQEESIGDVDATLQELGLEPKRQARIKNLYAQYVEKEKQDNVKKTKEFVSKNQEGLFKREKRELRADIKDISGEKKGRKEALAQNPFLYESEEFLRNLPATVAGGAEKFVGGALQLPNTVGNNLRQVADDKTANPLARFGSGLLASHPFLSNPLNNAINRGAASLGEKIERRGEQVLGGVQENLEGSKAGQTASSFVSEVVPYLLPGAQVRGAGAIAGRLTQNAPKLVKPLLRAGVAEGIEDSAVNAIASANTLQDAINKGEITFEEAIKRFPQEMAINFGTDVVGAGVLKGAGKAIGSKIDDVTKVQKKAERGRKIQAGQEKVQAERDLVAQQTAEREALDDYLIGLGVKQGEEVAKAQKPLTKAQKQLDREIEIAKKEASKLDPAVKEERVAIKRNIAKTKDPRYLATFQDAVYKSGDEQLINNYENRKAKIIQEQQLLESRPEITKAGKDSAIHSTELPPGRKPPRAIEQSVEGPKASELQSVDSSQNLRTDQELPINKKRTFDEVPPSTSINKYTQSDTKIQPPNELKGKPDGELVKERKFAKSIRESDQIAPAVKEKFQEGEYNYEVRRNRELVQSARNRIESKGIEKAELELTRKDRVDYTDDDVAEGIEIAKQYQESGKIEDAVRVFDELVQAGTAKGRAVQAFRTLNLYENMSPETALYAATKKARKLRSKGKNAKLNEAAEVAAGEVKEGVKRVIRKKAKELIDEIDKFCGF